MQTPRSSRKYLYLSLLALSPIMFLQSAFANENVLQIKANMVVDTPEALLAVVDRAKAKGANVVKYGDTKLNRFGLGESPGATWEARTREFIEGVKARDMEIILNTATIGYCTSLIASDTNLATGYPLRGQQLRAVGGQLVPVSSSQLSNGGFESFDGNTANGWGLQDAPGSRTFIDTDVKRSGSASLRAEAKNGEMSRVGTVFPVKPFHQYTLRFWMKAENLTAQNLLVVVRDQNEKSRNLTNQRMSFARDGGGRGYFNSPSDLTTTGWQEMRIAFNSLNATEVNLGLSMFGGVQGKVWYDDVRIVDTPTLNWINRDDLPVSLINTTTDQTLTVGEDISTIVDESLGNVRFPGNFATYHQPPAVNIENTASVREGDIVELSGYHAVVTQRGQTACSWNNEKVFERIKRIHTTLWQELEPTGFLINYDEIRNGGYEPSDTGPFANSGEALAASIARVYEDVFEVAPSAKHYFWSDMIDPFHNAVENYYQINNTLEGAWSSLDPSRVTLITWWEGQKITDFGPSSLKFFSDLGFKQILGAFYDADVQDNYDRWQAAAAGIPGIEGGLYATWVSPPNYTQIEAFGDLWWQNSAPTVDEIVDLNFDQSFVAGDTYIVRVPYKASQPRDLMLSLQNTEEEWRTLGFNRVSVPAGEGVAEFTLAVLPEAVAGDNYALTTAVLPSGENWTSRFDHKTLRDITVTNAGENSNQQ